MSPLYLILYSVLLHYWFCYLSLVVLSTSSTQKPPEGQATQLPTTSLHYVRRFLLKIVSQRIQSWHHLSESTGGFRVMREIGRQGPSARLILHQCCSRCLALCVMRNLAAKQVQRLNLPSSALCTLCQYYCWHRWRSISFSHVPRVKNMCAQQSRCTANHAGGALSF